MAAAWVVWKAYGAGNVDFHPGVYGEPPPAVAGRDVFIVDFSYPKAVLQNMLRSGARMITLLDHHKTAAEDLGIGAPFEGFVDMPGELADIRVSFVLERSGCGVTWDYLFSKRSRPRALDLIEDRDLWRFRYPETKAWMQYLMSFPMEFRVWNEVFEMTEDAASFAPMVEAGRAILRKFELDVALAVKQTHREMRIGGHMVPVVNVPYSMCSEAANSVCQGRPFGASYYDGPARRYFSLRSNADGIDVSAIAKKYGGGGHAHAAGFSIVRGKVDQEDLLG
jgi:oligoribonuclease NrnB/cAMP/cGMP phosphodiesterase (DHH superfamily)